MQAQILPALKELFRPELLNRFDDVIIFHTLEPEHLREIVNLMIEKTCQRIAEQSITLHVSDAARALLSAAGWLPSPGETVLDHVAMSIGSDGLTLREARRRAYGALDRVGDLDEGQRAPVG